MSGQIDMKQCSTGVVVIPCPKDLSLSLSLPPSPLVVDLHLGSSSI